jgi:twinfilin-like protein
MIHTQTEMLVLGFYKKAISCKKLAVNFPVEPPSLTFYRHLRSGLVYFVYCSPDSAPVKERMTYTMSIPELVNIIASDNGVVVDKKREITDGEELTFA